MLYIDGQWMKAADGKTFTVINPANGDTVGEVADGGREDTQKAIEAAHRAFPAWSALPAKERGRFMMEAVRILREQADRLAETITKEMGKPLAEAQGEVQSGLEFLEWYAEEGKRVYGDTIPASVANKRYLVLKQPVGVVAAITPWNFPFSMVTRKIAPAIAAGCTVVLKPAPATPLTAMAIFEAFDKAGFPPGVVNLITSDRAEEVGEELMKSPLVRKVTFTGSTAVGKLLMKQAAETMKSVSFELGGHAPFIVFEDADLEKAAEGALLSKFRNAGQTCICSNRIYVHEKVAEAFGAKLAEKVKGLRLGNGLDEATQIGPLVNQAALDKVDLHVRDAVAQGAQILCGGGRWVEGEGAKGYFYQPTLLMNVTKTMRIAHEETFGPVAPIFVFRDEEEVIREANDTRYGLAAYFYTKDLSRAIRVMEALEYGIVGVNDPVPVAVQAPFGGMKESGIGREGGKYGIEEYLEEKFVSIGL